MVSAEDKDIFTALITGELRLGQTYGNLKDKKFGWNQKGKNTRDDIESFSWSQDMFCYYTPYPQAHDFNDKLYSESGADGAFF